MPKKKTPAKSAADDAKKPADTTPAADDAKKPEDKTPAADDAKKPEDKTTQAAIYVGPNVPKYGLSMCKIFRDGIPARLEKIAKRTMLNAMESSMKRGSHLLGSTANLSPFLNASPKLTIFRYHIYAI